mgnify:CR=1 FL=1
MKIDTSCQKFGSLTAIKENGKTKNGKIKWLCKCDCGNETVSYSSNLRSGHAKTCGDKTIHRKTHSMSYTRPYRIWGAMISRCSRKTDINYHNYGGRGITVCDKWKTFQGFWDDMKEGYSDNLSIDRLNNNKGYYKENCRWATREEQDNNTCRSRKITFMGETQTLTQWAYELNMNPKTLDFRFRNGWSVERALTTPVDKKLSRKITEVL